MTKTTMMQKKIGWEVGRSPIIGLRQLHNNHQRYNLCCWGVITGEQSTTGIDHFYMKVHVDIHNGSIPSVCNEYICATCSMHSCTVGIGSLGSQRWDESAVVYPSAQPDLSWWGTMDKTLQPQMQTTMNGEGSKHYTTINGEGSKHYTTINGNGCKQYKKQQ